MCDGKCTGSCKTHAGCNHDTPAAAPQLTVGFEFTQQPCVISGTKGNVRLKGGLFLVTDGTVRAMSGSTVIVLRGKVIANPGSVVIAYPGVEVDQRKRATVIRPSIIKVG